MAWRWVRAGLENFAGIPAGFEPQPAPPPPPPPPGAPPVAPPVPVPEWFRYNFPSPYVPTPADENNNNNAQAIQHPVAPMLAMNPVNPAAAAGINQPQQNADEGGGNDVPAIVDQGPRGPDAIRGELMFHFTDRRATPGFQFVKFLGSGTYGTAALIHDHREAGGGLPPRKLVVKRGFGKAGQWGIKREIEYLKVVRGGHHFAQLLAFRDRLDDDPWREIRELFGRRGRYIQGLPGPTLVTDYAENGTFEEFYLKCCVMERHVPNRLLWSLLLCGIRMCVGMSWPCMAPHKAPMRTETIDAPQRAPILLEHNDMHMQNVLFADIEHGSAEHNLVPSTKLIDFGTARDATFNAVRILDAHKGPFWNTRDTAGIVMALIAKEYNWQIWAGAFLDGTIETDAWDLYMPGAQQRYPWLDEELRELIGRMMAKEEQHRWPLTLCLQKAENAVRTRTAQSYGINWREETDQAIMQFIQEAFHDPPAPPGPPRPLPQPPGPPGPPPPPPAPPGPARPLPVPPLQMFQNQNNEGGDWDTDSWYTTDGSGTNEQQQGDEMDIDSASSSSTVAGPSNPPPNRYGLRPARRLPRPLPRPPLTQQQQQQLPLPPPVPPHLEWPPPPVPPHLEGVGPPVPPHLVWPPPPTPPPQIQMPSLTSPDLRWPPTPASQRQQQGQATAGPSNQYQLPPPPLVNQQLPSPVPPHLQGVAPPVPPHMQGVNPSLSTQQLEDLQQVLQDEEREDQLQGLLQQLRQGQEQGQQQQQESPDDEMQMD
ncbi:hypothetical protein PG984_016123 [Apiospora sp. TS-2023a]